MTSHKSAISYKGKAPKLRSHCREKDCDKERSSLWKGKEGKKGGREEGRGKGEGRKGEGKKERKGEVREKRESLKKKEKSAEGDPLRKSGVS